MKRASIGDDVSIGSRTVVEHHVTIADRVRLHSGCFVPEYWCSPRARGSVPESLSPTPAIPTEPDTKDILEGVTIRAGARIGRRRGAAPWRDRRCGGPGRRRRGRGPRRRCERRGRRESREVDPLTVPFLDLGRLHSSIRADLDAAVRPCRREQRIRRRQGGRRVRGGVRCRPSRGRARSVAVRAPTRWRSRCGRWASGPATK